MSIVIIYQSKYGATKKYAQWLAEELSGDLVETKKPIEQMKNMMSLFWGVEYMPQVLQVFLF